MLIISECYKAPKISAKLVGGTDYLSWAQEAEASLMTSGVWKYLNEHDISPQPLQAQLELNNWGMKNKILIAILTLLIEHPLQHLMKGSSSALEAMETAVECSIEARSDVSDQPDEKGPCNSLNLKRCKGAAKRHRCKPGTEAPLETFGGEPQYSTSITRYQCKSSNCVKIFLSLLLFYFKRVGGVGQQKMAN